jgi:hypothetical protein
MKWKDSSPYLKPHEFDSPDKPGSGEDNMNMKFIAKLYKARIKAGIPFVISSGYRTPERNEILKKRGYKVSNNSPHLRGNASDIKIENSFQRFIILKALFDVGFKRLGFGDGFIHCDCETKDKAQEVCWDYFD